MEQQALEQNTFVSADGYLINADTGEVLEAVDPGLEGRELCEWSLAKRMDAEAQILALSAKRDAIVGNIERQIKEQEQRVSKLAWKYDALIESYARDVLKATGEKTKTVKFDHGSVSFRSSKGTNEITDMDAAVAFAEKYKPDIVKVRKSVNVTDCLDVAKSGIVAGELTFIKSSGPKETVKIETGVKVSE